MVFNATFNNISLITCFVKLYFHVHNRNALHFSLLQYKLSLTTYLRNCNDIFTKGKQTFVL
jgi:hypothetical protein